MALTLAQRISFEHVGSTWVEQQKLLASDGQVTDFFGQSVAISGDRAIIGAWGDGDNGHRSGSAYIFEQVGGMWVEQQKLIASDGQANDRFGLSVAISDDSAIAGANGDDDNGSLSGSAYAYHVPSFTLRLKSLTRSATGTKKVKLKWTVADINKGKLDFYVDETPDGSYLKRTKNDGKIKLKLPSNQFPGDGPFAIHACAKNSTIICSNVIIADFTGVAPRPERA